MKINEIITEGKWKSRTSNKSNKRVDKVFVVGNEHAKIARTAKGAAKIHKDANVGAIEPNDPLENLKKVRDMYGMQLVDDFLDVLELPNAEGDTDKEMSMFSKDNR